MKDPKLSLCTPATRGVWIDLLCAMHELDRSGQLRGTTEQLARLARCSTKELETALTELQTARAADVIRRNDSWAIANRRMTREAILRGKRAEAGQQGGSKTASMREQKPDTDNDIDCRRVVVEYTISLGLPASDGEAVFEKWQGNGWTNRGDSIRDWKATIRSWKLQGYMPSQKIAGANGATLAAPSRPMSAFEIEKRISAINDRINVLWRDDKVKHAVEIQSLKSDRQKLKDQLAHA